MSTDGKADYRALFTEMVRKPDEDIELDRAALYLAGEEYPAIDVPSLLAELDAFASQIRRIRGHVGRRGHERPERAL